MFVQRGTRRITQTLLGVVAVATMIVGSGGVAAATPTLADGNTSSAASELGSGSTTPVAGLGAPASDTVPPSDGPEALPPITPVVPEPVVPEPVVPEPVVPVPAPEPVVPEPVVPAPEPVVPEPVVPEPVVPAPEGAESPDVTVAPVESTEPDAPALESQAIAPTDAPELLAADKATLVIRAGGDRTESQTVGGLSGVVFNVYEGRLNSPPGSGATAVAACTTEASGTCSVDVSPKTGGGNNAHGYWVVQQAAPTGWFLNSQFNVGGIRPYRHFTGNVVAARSYEIPITATGTSSSFASGGINALSRVNPEVALKCGLDIAILVDLSGSVAGNIGDIRSAAKGFASALAGTPSQMAVYTFAGGAPAAGTTNLALTSLATPASTKTVTDYIDTLKAVSSGSWQPGTNWDDGLWQIANAGMTYDMVLVITDGDPTLYGPNHEGPGGSTRFREVENAAFSANAIKAKGTKIIAAGVGTNVSGSKDNLIAISGQTLGDDYFMSGFVELEKKLTDLAAAACDGTISVVKKVISSGGTAADAETEGGWIFSTSTEGVTPPSGTTEAATGATNFAVSFLAGETSKAVIIEEDLMAGYSLTPVDGANAVCTAGVTDLPVTNVGTMGFSVDASPTETVTCTVLNQAPTVTAQVRVVKSWTIDGVNYTNVDRPNGFGATLHLTEQETPQFNISYPGYTRGQVVTIGESVAVPPGCTNVASGDLGEQALPGGSSVFTLQNTVTCQTELTLVKEVENSFGAAAEASGWTLNATKNGDANPTLTGATGTPGVSSVSITPGETYVLTESVGPDGYAQEKVAGYNPNPGFVPQPTGSWHCRIDGALVDYDGLNGGVTVQRGQSVTCTAINRAVSPKLTLVKAVDNGTTGGTAVATDWNLTATVEGADSPALAGASGAPEVTGVDVPAGVDLVVAEDGGPSGYDLSAITCAVTGTDTDIPITADGALQLAIGQDATCTLTNVAQQSTLTLVKTVSGASPDSADSWTLNAVGPQTISGVTGAAETTRVPVTPGSFALSESGPSVGYVASDWVCAAGRVSVPVTGSVVPVALGQDVTCTVNNTAQPTYLRILKTVQNTRGGTADAADWNLKATGPSELSGTSDVSGVVLPGHYVVTEAGGPAGYAQTGFECWINGSDPQEPVATTDGALDLARGQGVTCELTNSDQAATLTLAKIVSPGEAGGTLDPPSAWTLSAAGPTPVTGPSGDASVTAVPVFAGTYDLSETGPSGYAPGTWQCEGGVVTGSKVTIANGATVYCAIANTALSPRLTLVKEVENSFGGTLGPLDWTLTANGPSNITGISGSDDVTSKAVEPGRYLLSETEHAGYEMKSLTCATSGGDPIEVTESGIDVTLGDNVVCTFANRDLPSQLKLIKRVAGNGVTGGTATPEDWTLKAALGAETVIEVPGASEFTPAKAGTYVLTETADPTGPTDGYTAGAWECRAEDSTVIPTVGIGDPGSGAANVAIPLDSKVTCTIINTAQPSEWMVVKSSDPASGSTVAPGDEIKYTLTLTKLSGVAGTNIVITDDLSEVLNNAALVGSPAFTPSVGTATQSGDQVTWSVPILTNTATLSYTAKVNDNATGVTLTNAVTRDGGTCEPDRGDICDTEHFTPGWTLAKSSNPNTGAEVLPGATIQYSLAVTNTGSVPVTGLTVTDDLSALTGHASVISTTVAADDGTWNLTASELQWTIPSIPVGPTPVTLRFTVTVDADAWDVNLKNTVAGTGEVPPNECAVTVSPDAGRTGEPPCGTTHLTPKQPKFAMIKSVDNGTRATLATPQDWTLTATPVVLGSQAVRSGPGGFESVAVQPGEFYLTEHADNPIAQRGFSPDAWVCEDGAAVPPAPVTVTGAGAVRIAAGADVVCKVLNRAVPVDLSIAKTHTDLGGLPEVIADPGKGQQFRYRLVVSNSDTPASGVSITDAIPESLTVDAGSISAPAGWTAGITGQNGDGSGGTLNATFGETFEANQSAEITFVVTIGDISQPDATVAIPDIENTACVTSVEGDSSPANNCSTDNVPVKHIILTALAVCRVDAPMLDYSVAARNYTATGFTLRWWNEAVWNDGNPTGVPSAETVITLDQLEGSLLWPGAVLDANGKIIEWPGWRDGGTVEDPAAPGGDLRPSAVVEIVSNPSVESATVYPPATPDCDPNPPVVPPPTPTTPTTPTTTSDSPPMPVKLAAQASGNLPRTGMDVAGWLGAAAAAIVIGAAIRRRSRV